MTFPAGKLPAVTELLIDGAWVDVTSDVRNTDQHPGLSISRGRGDEFSRVSPSKCTLTLNNRAYRYSSRLATSPYYGLIGRNTQLRHRLRWVYDTFGRTVTGGLGSDETAMANSWTIVSGLASDWNVSSVTGLATVLCSTASISRLARVGPVLADARTTGLVKPGVVATGAQIDIGYALRRDNATDSYYEALLRFEVGGTMRLRVNKVVSGAATNLQEVVLSGTYTATTLMWIVADVKGSRIRVRAWDSTGTEPTSWDLDFTDSAVTTPGQYGGLRIRVQAGNTNVPFSPGWSSVDVSDYRFWGEVPSWPQTWEISGADVTAPIEAAGIMRRLGAGAKPLRSAMFQSMAGISDGDFQPVAYWSMEDGSSATQFGSAIPGQPPAVWSGAVSPASYSAAAGSDPVPILNSGGQIAGTFPVMTLPANSAGSVIWQFQFMGMVPSSIAADGTFLEIYMPPAGGDNIATMRVSWVNASKILTLRLYSSSGTLVGAGADIDFTSGDLYDRPVLFGVSAFSIVSPVAPAVQFAAFLPASVNNGVSPISAGVDFWSASTLPPPSAWRAYGNSANAGWSFSHAALYTDPEIIVQPNQQVNANGIDGHVGETAADRMIRLCREEGIAFTLVGDAADTQLMGAQQSGTLLSNLQACADADQGILCEPRDAFGLQYRTNRSLLNQTGPALDYAAKRLAPPLTPTDDDQQVRNRVTATRTGGSSATAELTEGSLSTQDPPDGVGPYEEQFSVNAYTDSQLQYLAGWRVRLGTWNEARFPQVSVNFARLLMDGQASLAGQVAALDVGDYLSITNPPAWLPPDAIELLAQGYRETHRGFEWMITYNAIPAGPYNAFVIGDQTDGRLDTSGCIVNEALTSGATSAKLCIWDGPPSITTAGRPGDFNFDLALRPAPLDANTGERVRVTAMGSVTVPTFVGVGTGSSGSSGSRTPGMPAGVAAGDLVLIFASTRNAGTGTVDTPADWTQLLDMGNAALLGRIYDGVWAMPTVTFTGGAASEDTLAQSAAFRTMCADLTRVVHSSTTQVNASAQNIATGLLGVRRDNCVILHLGWKQDDYTNVAAISGSTEIQELSSAAGNDASQVWDYRIQTTAAGIDENTFTVTGGASAISVSAVVALVGGTQTATLTRSINGVVKAHAAGTTASLWRPARPAL